MRLIQYAPGQFARIGERVTRGGVDYVFSARGWRPLRKVTRPVDRPEDGARAETGTLDDLTCRRVESPKRRAAVLPTFTRWEP